MASKPHIYFILTRNCNLQCRHCYISAEPRLHHTTIDLDDFSAVIGNIPKVRTRLELTGGEVFTIPNFYDYLEVTQQENRRRKENKQEPLEVEVQTNGTWGTGLEKIGRTITELADLGVMRLRITSKDQYHEEQGVKRKNLELIQDIAEESKRFDVVSIGGAAKKKEELIPMGRARSVLGAKITNNWNDICFCIGSLDHNDFAITIREDGTVYNCCSQRFQLPGNAITESIDTILEEARQDKRLSASHKGAIEAVMTLEGVPKDQAREMIMKYGCCGACFVHTEKF